MTEPKWKEFEKLATEIYEQLQPYAVVKHDDKVYDMESESDRQIDVSIRFNVKGREYLTIVQTKNLKTPADVNTVDELSGVLRGTGADRAVLICKSGFTKGAVKKAENFTKNSAKKVEKQSIELEVDPNRWTEFLAI